LTWPSNPANTRNATHYPTNEKRTLVNNARELLSNIRRTCDDNGAHAALGHPADDLR
jgi:hypothetical protein